MTQTIASIIFFGVFAVQSLFGGIAYGDIIMGVCAAIIAIIGIVGLITSK